MALAPIDDVITVIKLLREGKRIRVRSYEFAMSDSGFVGIIMRDHNYDEYIASFEIDGMTIYDYIALHGQYERVTT